MGFSKSISNKILFLILSMFSLSAFSLTIVAHRGGAENDLPESSLEAFERSIQRGISILETDMHLTKDNHVIIYHDPYLFKDKKLSIVNLTYQEAVRIGKEHKFNIVGLSDIAQLVHKAIANSNIQLELEIKYTSPAEIKYSFYKSRNETVSIIMKELTRLNLLDRVMISSFDEEILKLVRHQYPHVPLKYLYRGVYFGNAIGNPEKCKSFCFWPNWKKAIYFVMQNKIEAFAPSSLLMTHPIMKKLRPVPSILKKSFPVERSFKLSPWTVNTTEDLNKLLEVVNVDELITDYPMMFKN